MLRCLLSSPSALLPPSGLGPYAARATEPGGAPSITSSQEITILQINQVQDGISFIRERKSEVTFSETPKLLKEKEEFLLWDSNTSNSLK